MQEIIIFTFAAAALVYLFRKFISKRKSHDCDKCGLNNNELEKQ